MRYMLFSFLLVFFMTVTHTIATEPGVVLYFKENGLQKVLDSILPTLVAELEGITIPDIEGSKDSIKYKIKKINLKSVGYKSANITLVDRISIVVNGLSIKVTLDWEYREKHYPHIPHGKGTAEAKASDSSLSLGVSGKEVKGKLVLNTDSCHVKLHDFKIEIHGNILDWLYKILVDLFKGSLHDAIEHAIEKELTQSIDTTLNKMLATFPWRSKIDDETQIDYTLTSDPTFPNYMVRFGVTGAFEKMSDPTPPIVPHGADLTNPATTKEAVDFFFDQYVINSAFWTYCANDRLQGFIHDKDLPTDCPIRLNTSAFNILIPILFKEYPNDAMRIFFDFIAPPVITLTADGNSAIDGSAIALFSVNNSNTSKSHWIPVFTLNVSIIGTVNASFKVDTLVGHIGELTFKISQKNSTVGNVPCKLLNPLIQLVLSRFVLPKLNEALAKGIVVPVIDGLKFISPTLTFGHGFLRMSTNINYTFPPTYIL